MVRSLVYGDKNNEKYVKLVFVNDEAMCTDFISQHNVDSGQMTLRLCERTQPQSLKMLLLTLSSGLSSSKAHSGQDRYHYDLLTLNLYLEYRKAEAAVRLSNIQTVRN